MGAIGSWGIAVTSPSEMFTGQAIHREIAFWTERNLDLVLPFHKQGSEVYILDWKGIIDYPFSISYLVFEPFEVLFSKYNVRGMEFMKNCEPATYSISQKP